MDNVKDSEMKTKMPYSVPEGYFPSLQEKLSAIPAGASRRGGFSFSGMARNLAWAACAAIVTLVCVNLIGTRDHSSEQAEDIVEYLIESGTTLAQIANILDYQ